MEEKKEIFIIQKFSDTDMMEQSSINWKYDAVYKLMPNAFSGENDVILLPSLQLSYAKRSGGILYNVTSPKGTVSVGVILESKGKLCYGQTKLKEGDITFFDDKKPINLVNSDDFASVVISIPKKGNRKLTQRLAEYFGKVLEDRDRVLTKKLMEILTKFKKDASVQENTDYQEKITQELLKQIESLLDEQTPYFPKLTKGEKIALQIRDRIYKRVTKKVTITALAEEFGVSEQTLQNAFKSLFGITPNKFLRNLKLNHVRKALVKASPHNDTIVRIANRWGFTHMGHFSRYYTDLFGENPSVTLCHLPDEESGK
jgi:AraC-like DNA-binding protein